MYKNFAEGLMDREVYELWLKKCMDEVNSQQIKLAASNNISNYRVNNIGETLTHDEGDDS